MATLAKDTIDNILQEVADLRGELSNNTNALRVRAASRADRDFAQRRLWRFYLLPLQEIAGDGSSDYTIGSSTYPMRYKGLTEVFVGGTTEDKRYQVRDYLEYLNDVNNNPSANVCYEWYDAVNDAWKLHINNEPTDTIYYSYFWIPPKKTSSSDAIVCPNMDIIIRLTLAAIYESEDETQKALLAKKEAEALIGELTGIENTPAKGQLYQMSSIENSITSRGIGSY